LSHTSGPGRSGLSKELPGSSSATTSRPTTTTRCLLLHGCSGWRSRPYRRSVAACSSSIGLRIISCVTKLPDRLHRSYARQSLPTCWRSSNWLYFLPGGWRASSRASRYPHVAVGLGCWLHCWTCPNIARPELAIPRFNTCQKHSQITQAYE